jgi:sorbitol-specific phosphotransferase system component IIBC
MDFQLRTIKNQIAATKRLIASGCKQFIVQLIDLETKQEELETAIAQQQAAKQAKQKTKKQHPARKRRSMMDTAKILAGTTLGAQFQTRQDCVEYVLYNFSLITEQIQVCNPDFYELIMYKRPRQRRV